MTGAGLLAVFEEHQGSRQKKYYEITPAGRELFLDWLGKPFHLEESNGSKSHLAKVYFFDILPPDSVKQQLLEYEASNTQYLQKLLDLEKYYSSPKNHENYYYKLSTLYYGIAIVRETIRWCRHVREKRPFGELFEGGETHE